MKPRTQMLPAEEPDRPADEPRRDAVETTRRLHVVETPPKGRRDEFEDFWDNVPI